MRPTWVLFGDSITQRSFSPGGWAGVLADAYQRRVDVINRGYSGYTSRIGVALLDRVFPAGAGAAGAFTWPPQLATVFFGANDAALPDRTS
jgi:isoamyl acetate esterase